MRPLPRIIDGPAVLIWPRFIRVWRTSLDDERSQPTPANGPRLLPDAPAGGRQCSSNFDVGLRNLARGSADAGPPRVQTCRRGTHALRLYRGPRAHSIGCRTPTRKAIDLAPRGPGRPPGRRPQRGEEPPP